MLIGVVGFRIMGSSFKLQEVIMHALLSISIVKSVQIVLCLIVIIDIFLL